LIQRLGHRRKAVLAAFQAVATREPEQEGQQTFFNPNRQSILFKLFAYRFQQTASRFIT
jgi:hypothetical protein